MMTVILMIGGLLTLAGFVVGLLVWAGVIKCAGRALGACMLAAAVAFGAGCRTVNKDNIEAAGNWAEKYYTQPNMAEVLQVRGSNVTWTVTGATEIVLSTPVPTKSVIPQSPQWYDGLYDTIRTVAPYAFMGWMFRDGVGNSKTTINNAAAQ